MIPYKIQAHIHFTVKGMDMSRCFVWFHSNTSLISIEIKVWTS